MPETLANSTITTTFFNFDAFDPHVTTFGRWVKRLETAMDIYGCDQAKKPKILLHYLGAATYNVFCDKLAPRTPEQLDFKEISDLLSEHFDPKPNEILENYRFNMPGKIVDIQTRLYLKPTAKPRFLKARRVAFPLWEAVEKELDSQVDEGLLIKVDQSEWAPPIVAVRKRNGAVRICGDYKVTLNPEILVDEHPIPTIEELFSKMAGGNKFSKIDLSKAYLQLEVHPEDRHLMTLNTHKGLYQPTRLMFGIASAPAKWQRLMEQVFGDIPGVSVFLDDIKITAENDDIHMQRLKEVFQRLEKFNMRVNWEKCELMRDSIEYCGYLVDKEGIRRLQKKVNAIQNMKTPNNKEEVRAFLGLINYYGRFVKNLSSITFPLNQLMQDNVEFDFNQSCEQAFVEVKKQMQTNTVLTFYDPNVPIVLAVDASPIGVGAVLSHEYGDGTEKPIQFASQTLSKVQQRYSQIDKEAYAVIFGVRKFYQYIYGRKFTLVTDNKAIAQIFAPNKGLPTLSATRMQHYAIFLEHFDFGIRCKQSKENANADALSRLPIEDENTSTEEVDIIEDELIENLPVTVAELREQTMNDEEIKVLMQCLKYGRDAAGKDRFGIPITEFSIHNGCIMRGIRVYILKPMRQRILKELHTAHLGMNKMKLLARGYCWWHQMDKDIEDLVANCSACQVTRSDPKKIPTQAWKLATRPFERVHVDYAGPFLGKYLFVMVDAYTKWPEVHVVPNITTQTTIEKCREIFAIPNLPTPNILVSDHGTQFNAELFKNFLKNNGTIHKQGAPYHPATNGQAERFVQTIKNKLKISKCTGNEIAEQLPVILMAYRRAIHPATGKSPAMLMFGRQIQSRLELLLPKNEKTYNENNNEQNSLIKHFSAGERVAARNYLGKDKWQFATVIAQQGDVHYQVRLDDQRIWKRHVDQLRRVGKLVSSSQQNHEMEVQDQRLPTPMANPTYADCTPPVAVAEVDKQMINNDTTPTAPETFLEPAPSEASALSAQEKASANEAALRRSARTKKTPARYHDA
ncbi:hypothetical protein ACLKA7_005042 [Drosophila subpalustris]